MPALRLVLKHPRSKAGGLNGFRNLSERVLAVSTIAPLFVGALLSALRQSKQLPE